MLPMSWWSRRGPKRVWASTGGTDVEQPEKSEPNRAQRREHLGRPSHTAKTRRRYRLKNGQRRRVCYRPRSNPKVHYLRSSRRCPVQLGENQHYGWCACGALKIGSPAEIDGWWETHRGGVDLTALNDIARALRPRPSRALLWRRVCREAVVLTHAAVVLREHAGRHPVAVAHTLLSSTARLIRLAVDVLPAVATQPNERTVHKPILDEFERWTYEDLRVERSWRDGRRGWLDVETGAWFASVAVAGAATIVGSVAGGNWNTNAAWIGSVQPTAADDVTLTVASGSISVTAGSLCRSLVMTSYAGTLNGSGDLSIGDGSGGACTLAGTISGTWTTTFKSTSNNGGTGWAITSGAKIFPGMVTFDGVGGKWVLQDTFSSNANAAGITVTNGAFFGNGQSITAARLSSGGATTRTVDLTSCAMTCNQGGLSVVWALVATGLTWVAPTTLTINTGSSTTFQGGGLTYLSGSFTNVGNAIIQGANTWTNLTRTGTAVKTDGLSISATQTVTGTITVGGNTTQGVNRLLVFSATRGTQQTFNCTSGAVVIGGDVDFMDVNISGTPGWTNSGAKFVGDCGGNSGLTITVAATQTATGTASFTWSTHGWTSRVPLPQDTVSIPNAFVATRVVTVDMPRLGGDISFAGGSGSPTLTNSVANESYGSLTLVAGVTPSGTNLWTLAGRGTHTLTSAGATFTQGITQNGPSGTYTLQDAFVTSRAANPSLTLTNGTLVDNGKTVTLSGATSGFSMTAGTLTKTGAWASATTATGSYWSVTGGTLTDSSSITLSATSTNTRTFAGGGKTYGTLTYTVAGSTGQLTVTGSNSFSTINFSDVTNARTLAFTNGTTTTITSLNGFNVQGTATKLMSIASTSSNNAFTLTSSFNQSVQYVSVKDSTAAGTGNWVDFAGTSVSGNTNWFFDTVPVAVIAGTGTVFTPTIVKAALPSFVDGQGAVQSPTGVEVVFPSFIAGVGTVFTLAEVDDPEPSFIAGTGTVFTPTGVEVVFPSFIAGTGTVQSPAPTDLPTPSFIAGTGTVFTPTGVEVAKPSFIAGTGTVFTPTGVEVALPSFIAGTGTVFTPTGVEVAKPSFIAGTGTVFTPTGVEVALPSFIAGTGTVQSATTPEVSTPAFIAGTGTVFTPTGVEVALPSFIAGTGTVQVPSTLAPTAPPFIDGQGVVITPDGVEVVFPSFIAGTGTVFTPTEVGKPKPSFIAGTGTVFTPTGVEVAKPSFVNGQGTVFFGSIATPVQTLSGVGSVQAPNPLVDPTPSFIAGTGTVFTPTGVEVAKPSFIAGTGTVQTPTEVGKPKPSFVAGTGSFFTPLFPVRLTTFVSGIGTVQTALALVTARPSFVLGIGTIQIPQSIALIWAGVTLTINVTKRDQKMKVFDRSMIIVVEERGDTVKVSEALGIRG